MNCTAQRVIEIARGCVGYHEGPRNSVPWLEDIFRDYPQMDDNAPWCDKFFDGCVVMACDYDYDHAEYVLCGKFDDYTVISARYYKEAGRYGNDPSIGAQVFFRNSDGICHTGIVTGYDDDTVYTIEGNAADEVQVRSYSKDDWSIDGYGYPRFDSAQAPTITESEDTMQFLYQPDGKSEMRYHDGTKNIRLSHPDQMKAIIDNYKMATGRDIAIYQLGTPEAPWAKRLEQCFPLVVADCNNWED